MAGRCRSPITWGPAGAGAARALLQGGEGSPRRGPTSHETLKRVLGLADLTGFERDWKRYVLGLRFEG